MDMIPESAPDPEASNPGGRKPKALSLSTVFFGSLVLAVIAVAALAFLYFQTTSEKRKLEQALAEQQNAERRHELDQRQAEERARLTAAQNRQQDALALARNAKTNLTVLQDLLNQVVNRGAALRTNDLGRRVALHPDLLAQARRLYEGVLPSLPLSAEVNNKLEGSRRAEQQLVNSLGTTYHPESTLLVELQNSAVWAEQEYRRVNEARNFLAALEQEPAVKLPDAKLTASSLTLAAAIDRVLQAEAAWRQRVILDETAGAKTNAAMMAAQVEAQKILEHARLEASNVLAQVAEAKLKMEAAQRVRDAELVVVETKSRVDAQTKIDDARRIELRKKASTPEVQGKLAPFITPGYWQLGGMQPGLKPHSLSALQSYGALETTLKGMDRLVEVACKATDHVRPRWKLERGRDRWSKSPQDMAKVQEAQELLIELGPVLVEMRLLEP